MKICFPSKRIASAGLACLFAFVSADIRLIQAQSDLGPVDASESSTVQSMVAVTNSDGSIDIAWRRLNGHVIVSNYSGPGFQHAVHTPVPGTLETFGGFARDGVGNGYILTLRKEALGLRDATGAIRDPKLRRPGIAQILRVKRDGSACLLVDLNQKSRYRKWGIYNPGQNHASALVFGAGTIAATFGHNIPGTDGHLHNTATLIGVDTNGNSTYSGGAGNHTWDDHLWFDGVNFVKVQDGDQGLLMSRLVRRQGAWQFSGDKLVYRRQSADPGGPFYTGQGGGELKEHLHFGMIANGSADQYLLLSSGAPGIGYAGSWGGEWNNDVQGAGLYLTKVPKSGFDLLPASRWPENPVGRSITTVPLALPQNGSTSNYVRPRIVQIAQNKFAIVFEQWAAGRTFERSLAMLVDGHGHVLVQPRELFGGPRIQRTGDAFLLHGRIAWIAGDNANQQILLHTMDASLNVQSHRLSTAGASTNRVFNIDSCMSADSTTVGVPQNSAQLTVACKPQGQSGGFTNIRRVRFTDLQGNVLLANEQDTADHAYEDFTESGKVLQVRAGQIVSAFIASHKTDRPTKIWIDANNDGAFDEASELWLNEPVAGREKQLDVPAHLKAGVYRLRIRQGWDHKDACLYDKWSQVEDYLLKITR